MVSLQRRRFLHAAVALLAGGAGCNDVARDSPTATERAPPRRSSGGTVPPHQILRNDEQEPAVWFAVADTDSPDDTPPARRGRLPFVASAETAGRVRFADGVGETASAAARRLLAETSFESETVYVEVLPIETCYELALCDVRWSETEIETDYGRVLRPADVDCEDGRRVYASALIRIPAALDPDEVTSHGTSFGSGTCAEHRGRDPDPSTDYPRYGPATGTADSNATTSDRSATTSESNSTSTSGTVTGTAAGEGDQ